MFLIYLACVHHPQNQETSSFKIVQILHVFKRDEIAADSNNLKDFVDFISWVKQES